VLSALEPTSITTTHPYSIYAHIPFCRVKCSYCAFNVFVGLDHLIEPYLEALHREMRLVGAAAEAGFQTHTLYVGGGTPSVLSGKQVNSLIQTAREHLNLLPDVEISIEIEPATADNATLNAYRETGVNRASVGVQSVSPSELQMFNRGHTFQQAWETYDMVRSSGFDTVSVDLIYGAPNQSLQGWQHSLHEVLRWQPDHISLYSLRLEEKTAMHYGVHKGYLPFPDDDLAADMYDLARDMLAAAGFTQYEIASWAKPGHECIHNQQYWINQPFLGLGAGAHGADAGIRYWNVRSVHKYIQQMTAARAATFPFSNALEGYDLIDEAMAMSEALILGLRRVRDGVSHAEFHQRYGHTLNEIFGETLKRLVGAGLLTDDGETLRLAERAYLISNQVFNQLLPD